MSDRLSRTKGFIQIRRKDSTHRDVDERLRDYQQVALLRPDELSQEQAFRCMDCGTPFCHWGCPLGNYIPEWNGLVQEGNWKKAYDLLASINILPEITGRICPAPCEFSCVVGVNDEPVTIRENELAIVERAFRTGYIQPEPPKKRMAGNVAVVGSGPAGLGCAVTLNRMGYRVTVFEKDDRLGGILRYGIPDFKLEKQLLERRITLWEAEGVIFRRGTFVGRDISAAELIGEFDAVCLTGGCRISRDIPIEGRDLQGIHLAMDYLTQSNRRVAGDTVTDTGLIDAGGKKVVIIGGGDTGADCVGTANRQGARSVFQIEVLPRPPEDRPTEQPWPRYPLILRTSTSHEEGVRREWSVLTKRFVGREGHVSRLECVRVETVKDKEGVPAFREVPGSEFEAEADLVILAVGFVQPDYCGLDDELGIELNSRGWVSTGEDYMTAAEGVFSAGDMRSGPTLVVKSMTEGREAAESMGRYLSRGGRIAGKNRM